MHIILFTHAHVPRAFKGHGLEEVAHAVLLPEGLVSAARVHHQAEGTELCGGHMYKTT